MKKIITKLGVKTCLFLCTGIFFIAVGLALNFSIRKTTIANDKIEKMAAGDYFSLRLNNTSISHGDTAKINVKIADVNINSGDGGLGVIRFKLDYDKLVFSDIELNSSIATITKNDATDEVIVVVNNGDVIKSATDLMTISLKSKTTSNVDTSTIKLVDIKGTGGEIVSASTVSGVVKFSNASSSGETIYDSSIVTFRDNGNSNYSEGAGTFVTVTADDIKSIKYVWQEGTREPSNNEFQNILDNGGVASIGGVTGDYYLWVLVTLNSGNKRKAKSNVFKLDNKNPTVPKITSTNSISNVEVGQDVHLTISGSEALSGIKNYEYSFNNGASWNTYNQSTGITITDEGITEVIARAVSNTNKYSNYSSKYIVNIKREEMKLTYRVSTSEKTNEDVTVWINSNTKLVAPTGWTLYNDGYGIYKVYSTSKTESVNITDVNGNSDSVPVKIDNIDKSRPTVSASYHKKENCVEVTVTGNEELAELPGWSLLDDGKTLKKVYYNNKQEKLTVYDLAGNPSEPLQIDITSIEEGNFHYDVNYEKEVSSNSVKVTIKSDTALNNLSGWEMSTDKKTLTKVYTSDVSETVTITTMDNQKKNILLYYLINEDENEDSVYVVYSNTELTNGSVIVTIVAKEEIEKLDEWTLNGDATSISKVFSENIAQEVIVSYKNGSTEKVKIAINNIDKIAPIINDAVNHGVYKSLKLVFSEDVEEVIIEKNGKRVEYIKDMTLTEVGSYKISLKDKAGNVAIYDIVIDSNIQLVDVPDTRINYTKILIILGILEILIGILYIFKFKVNNKANIFLVILVLILSKSNSSIATTDALTANGYNVKNKSLLYNVEATTTTNDLKSNLFDDSSVIITKKSNSNYISTGDKVKYKSSTYDIIVTGDVDKDGQITDKDSSKMINHLINKSVINDTNSENAFDYNGDNSVDISDLYYVNKRVKKNNYVIEPKGIVVDSSNLSVDAGHSTEIKATVYPVNAAKKAPNYKIINGGSYLSISGNKIVGKKKGTGTVRVSVGNVCQDFSYTINNSYKLHVIDFPDGDAMVLESNGHYGMIDTGVAKVNGDLSAGYKKVDKYLQSIMDGERKKLDFMIISHAHSDHIGNATQIINNYGVKSLYAKRYSGQDNVAISSDRLSNQYSKMIEAAADKGVDINEYGITDKTFQISGRNTNSNKTVISFDAFTIKLHNISNEMEATGAVNDNSNNHPSENLNSLTQSITIKVADKTLRTYLEGDLTKSKFKRSIPAGVISNGHLTDKKTASVKAIVMWQAYDYLKLKDNKLDVYKPAHHSYFNGAQYNEIKTLRPRYVFSTASQSVIYEKNNENKNLCTIYSVKKFLDDNNGTFASRFKSSDKPIIYDYSTGNIKVSGGSAWDEKKYPFTSDKIDTSLKACGSLDIE